MGIFLVGGGSPWCP